MAETAPGNGQNLQNGDAEQNAANASGNQVEGQEVDVGQVRESALNPQQMPTADTSLVNPLDQKKENKAYESDVLKNIVETETTEEAEQILDEAPEIDTSLLEEVTETTSNMKLVWLKLAFGLMTSFSLLSILFFTSQLTDRFDFMGNLFNLPSVKTELESTNNRILSLQTDLNYYRYLQLKSNLDEFSYYGDSYLHAYETAYSQTTPGAERAQAGAKIDGLKENLRESFLSARQLISQPFEVPLLRIENGSTENEEIDPAESAVVSVDSVGGSVFEGTLKTKFGDNARAVSAEVTEGEELAIDQQIEQKTNVQAMRLVGNQRLKSLLTNTDFDGLNETELYLLIKDVNEVTVNDLSIIQEIKNQRIRWSDIMNEIDLRTIAVDRNYSDNFFDEIGGIRYTSYEFDKSGPSISIVGEIKRFDTTNFTMISNLIDSLNSSPLFEKGNMQSFSKSGSLDTGYTSALRLTLDIQELSARPNQEDTDIGDVEAELGINEEGEVEAEISGEDAGEIEVESESDDDAFGGLVVENLVSGGNEDNETSEENLSEAEDEEVGSEEEVTDFEAEVLPEESN